MTDLKKQKLSTKQLNRILLIDNDTSFRTTITATLAASSFIVDEAMNGLQALGKIKQLKPDLIILDSKLDKLDGFETCRLLRKNPIMTGVPIIMITELGDTDAIHRSFESGATDFIIKPFSYDIIIHRLRFILKASQDSSEIKNSNLKLTTVQRMARLGYWTWDVKHNHFEISDQLAGLCNINLHTFDKTLEGFLCLIDQNDLKMVTEKLLEAPINKTIRHIEYRLQVNQTDSIFVHQEMVKKIENGSPIITGTVQDISQRKASEKQIHHLAYFDALTGLASRTYYHEQIQSFIKIADRRNEKFAFLFLDLDGFKDINDSLGHNQGDELLKIIANRIKQEIRDVDFAARLGGDEFCILLSGIVDDESVAEVACRCLTHINTPLTLGQQQIRPRVSIGIAIYPRDGKNEIEIMKSADTAMYAAKEAGKQCYTFYSKDMALQAISRLEREQMLLEAFEEEQFMLHFQPQISMQTGRMIGTEALVRWRHPKEGMVPPDEFIPEIEQLGLVIPLGNWVIKKACEQIAKWHKSGLPFLHVAVNISALHFQDDTLLDTVKSILDKTGVPAQYLELEVTESAMHVEECVDIIKQLRLIGIKIAIDDFGTGYSCLASLKQLPFDSLKIDKVFIDDMLTNHHTSLLLGTIIGLANALDYKLVAEGVENKEQALVMHGLGCHIIQGYLFGRPVSCDKIPELIDFDFTNRLEIEQEKEL
ncbi:MAG: EAL domain-containing protein [Methylococcales bacterium]|nr:EAL domain-containing protein [Methylococcales bacterium]